MNKFECIECRMIFDLWVDANAHKEKTGHELKKIKIKTQDEEGIEGQ